MAGDSPFDAPPPGITDVVDATNTSKVLATWITFYTGDWYATKTHPSYQDMLVKLRRVLIAAQYRADPVADPTPEQIQAIRLAWADAAA